MSPEQWRRVKDILEAAWERDPEQQAAFLDEACAGDIELRSEVEKLLGSDRKAGSFLSSSAIDVAKQAAPGIGDSLESESAGFQTADRGPGDLLGGRYRILREIGHGGMGTVFLGERADGEYRKQVAIKVANPHLSPDLFQRFRNERQVEAAFDHPNIARLLDGGATDSGVPYLVMEYVDGVRIDEWCDARKAGRRDRIQLFQQVCAAVQYAHDKQVIHRDIKPGNILVTAGGQAKLLDFGIAKILDPELSEYAETTLGSGPMTLEYASPEQVRGEPAGAAADVYSLGVLLYVLLTGKLPYSARDRGLAEMARAVCEEEPAKPSEAAASNSARELRGDLDNIVLKALRKEPERRYRSVAEFSDDLERYLRGFPVHAHKESLAYRAGRFIKRNRTAVAAAGMTLMCVVAGAAGIYRWIGSKTPAEPEIRSIAVLPLENLSGDREQEYFAEGITDALIGDLSRIQALRVISRTSVMSYQGVRGPAREIAQALGVRNLVEGSVFRARNRLRITARLIDAAKDRPVWSGTYEGDLSDVMTVQRQVVEAIAGEIHITLSEPARDHLARHRRVDLGAYDAYLKGRHQYLSGFTKENVEKAMAYFRRALELDPGYAPAYGGLASCYFLVSNIYYPPTEVMPKAKAAAVKALQLDDAYAEAHGILGLVLSVYDFNRPEAEKHFQRALQLKPSDAEIRLWHGQHLVGMGRFDEAAAEMDQARKLDPASTLVSAYVGFSLFCARRFDEIIQRLQPVADVHPEYHHPHAFLALAHEQKGDYARAIAEMELAYKLDKEPEALAQLGHIYAAAGRTGDARKVLAELKTLARRRYVSAYNFAALHAGLGEREEAFRYLQMVEQDRSEWFAAVKVDPRLDGLHADPRFQDVLRSVGLN